jgi:hypothetical protein
VHRRFQCIDFVKKEVTQHGGYVSQVKEEGLAPKSKLEKVFDVQLPDNIISDFDPANEFADRFGVSYSGKCMFVEYMLMVFVKHDSWDQFGEGACVTFPMRIHQSPTAGPYNRGIVWETP